MVELKLGPQRRKTLELSQKSSGHGRSVIFGEVKRWCRVEDGRAGFYSGLHVHVHELSTGGGHCLALWNDVVDGWVDEVVVDEVCIVVDVVHQVGEIVLGRIELCWIIHAMLLRVWVIVVGRRVDEGDISGIKVGVPVGLRVNISRRIVHRIEQGRVIADSRVRSTGRVIESKARAQR